MSLPAGTWCDFCLEPEPPFEYMAAEIPLPGGTLSLGSWLACAACRALIDADDREGLARRSQQVVPRLPLAVIRETHALFFAARTSGAQPLRLTPMHGRLFER